MPAFAVRPNEDRPAAPAPHVVAQDEPLPHVDFEHVALNASRAPDSGSLWGHFAADAHEDSHPVVPAPANQQTQAVEAQVRVSDVDAAIERRGAAGQVTSTARSISDTAARIQDQLTSGKIVPHTAVQQHGDQVVETEYGRDGKPAKVTTVETEKDGTVKVTTKVTGESETIQTEKTDQDGKITVDETTKDLRKNDDGLVVHRHSVTDGESTTIDEDSVTRDGTKTQTHDDYTTQQGHKGIRGEVSEGFTDDGQTEVHAHAESSYNVFDPIATLKASSSETWSQGNHRVTRNQSKGAPTAWTQELQQGDDYHAQTTYEGQPNVLVQVSRHADTDHGTVTEQTATSDPIAGTVKSSASTIRGYDDDGRLVSSSTKSEDEHGVENTDYVAKYVDNPDGTTTVNEITQSDVKLHGQPDRKTTQRTNALDTKDGRQVNHVSTEVDVADQVSLIAESDGSTTTVQAPDLGGKLQTLRFDASGKPLDDATWLAVGQSEFARAIAVSGLDAVQRGAQASATGTTLLGPFADHEHDIAKIEQGLAQTISPFDGLDGQLGFGYLSSVGFGNDAAQAQSSVLVGDAYRLVTQAKTGIGDLLGVKDINDARKLDFDAAKLKAAEGELTGAGKAFGIASAALDLFATGQDLHNLFTAKNELDRDDASASAIADSSSFALGILALSEAGPPGWIAAAAALGLQAGATDIHDIDDDIRRGHPDEAIDEATASSIAGPLGGILLHLFFKDEDSDELRSHPLVSDVPTRT